MEHRLYLSDEFLDQAEDIEFYYNSLTPNLGDRFIDQLYSLLQKLEERPLTWQKVSPTIHRALVPGFPYSVFFRLKEEQLVEVLSVLHQASDPGKRPR
ncbi:MAG: type II toxin-antitoxin system RelE/ParE family toxin [Bacteroidota bacterium]